VLKAVRELREFAAKNLLASDQFLRQETITPIVNELGEVMSYHVEIPAPAWFRYGTVISASFAPNGTRIGGILNEAVIPPGSEE
jgi:hypothetical protein